MGAFYWSPVINEALIRSTLFGYKAIFLLPLVKQPQHPAHHLSHDYRWHAYCSHIIPRSSIFCIMCKNCSKNRKLWSRKDVPQKIKKRCRGREGLSKRLTTERVIKTHKNYSKRTLSSERQQEIKTKQMWTRKGNTIKLYRALFHTVCWGLHLAEGSSHRCIFLPCWEVHCTSARIQRKTSKCLTTNVTCYQGIQAHFGIVLNLYSGTTS